jgi:hypothetical protein
MPGKKKGTSRRIASEASAQLRDPASTKPEKSVAGSDLSQAGQKKGKK